MPEAVERGDMLYGDPRDPCTVRKLVPQARVVIRGSASCDTINHRDERNERRGPRAFRIFAAVSLNPSATWFGRSVASNTLPIEFVYPEP